MNRRGIIQLVETAYQFQFDDQTWLDELASTLTLMLEGQQGLICYLYDASEPAQGVAISRYALTGLDESFALGTILHHAKSPPESIRDVYHRGVQCSTISEALAPQGILPLELESFARSFELHGVEDAWGLSASDLDYRGVGVAAPLDEVSTMSERMRELWTLVGMHLTIAYRLRRSQRAHASESEAVLKPNGTLVHAGDQEA